MENQLYDLTWKPQIDKTKKPIYMEIVKTLESDIKKEILKPGDKLPPQRELADFLHINLTTVTKAFKICERKGLLYATVGKGTFISSDANIPTSLIMQNNENTIIEMGMLHPLYDQNKLVVESMRQVANKLKIENYFEYDEPKRKISHRELGVEWLKKFHVNPDADKIIIASGTQNALAVTLISLFEAGDKIGTDCLTYTGFKSLANMLGIRLVPIYMNKYGINTESLNRICKTEGLKGLYLMPECQNPTTYTMSLSVRKQIAKIIKDNGMILIEDDSYSFLGNTDLAPISELVPEQSIYINGTSKSLSAGLRVAFMMVPSAFYKRISRGIYNVNMNTSHFNVEIVANLIETGTADKIIAEKQKEAEYRNKIVNDIMSGYTIYGNNRDCFRWLILPDYWTGKEFELRAKMAGVQVFCAEKFAVGSVQVEPAVRISISSVKNQNDLTKGLIILKKLLQKNPNETMMIV